MAFVGGEEQNLSLTSGNLDILPWEEYPDCRLSFSPAFPPLFFQIGDGALDRGHRHRFGRRAEETQERMTSGNLDILPTEEYPDCRLSGLNSVLLLPQTPCLISRRWHIREDQRTCTFDTIITQCRRYHHRLPTRKLLSVIQGISIAYLYLSTQRSKNQATSFHSAFHIAGSVADSFEHYFAGHKVLAGHQAAIFVTVSTRQGNRHNLYL